MLLRSLQRALNRDDVGRRVIEKAVGPLFDNENNSEYLASGTIYVLKSKYRLM